MNVWLVLGMWLCRLTTWFLIGLACGMVLGMCSSAQAQDRIFADGFETPGEPGGEPPACTHSLIQPEGWVKGQRPWEVAWSSPDGSPQATYPNSVGFPIPLGAQRGGYTVIPFVAGFEFVSIYWEPVQANPQQGYGTPRPAEGMWMSLSPCAGDFRPADDTASDPFLKSGCRKGGASGGFAYGIGTTTHQFCALEPGETYYLNVIAADPSDGLHEGETSCAEVPNSLLRCHVQAVSRQIQ